MSHLPRFASATRRGRALPVSFVALLVLLLLAGRSAASSIRVPLTEISAASPVVVRGRVERIESNWTPDRLIESTVFVRLREAPRGHLSAGALIPVRVSGGRVDGLTMVSSEEPTFHNGEEVYLFLTGPKGDAYRVTEGQQGKFGIVGDRAINRASQTELKLADLEAGVREGRWSGRSTSPVGTPEPDLILPPVPQAGAWADAEAAPQASSPDGYVLSGQKWPGSRPMEESYLINVNTADAGGGNGSADAFRNALIASANTWSNAGANFSFKHGGNSGVTSSGNDGQNVVHWENMGNSATLAESTWWYIGSQIIEADMRMNDFYSWDVTGAPSSNEVDLQSVVTHEFGHWLSLGHDTDSSCPNSTAIMCATYRLGTLKRSLGAGDTGGIKALYGPPPAPPTNTPTPTYTPTRTPSPVPTLPPWKIKSRIRLPMIRR